MIFLYTGHGTSQEVLKNQCVFHLFVSIAVRYPLSVRIGSLWHVPPRCETAIRSQARHIVCISTINFYFSLVPIATRNAVSVFGSADLALFVFDHDGHFDPFNCQQPPNTCGCTVGVYGLYNGTSFITHFFLAFSPSFFSKKLSAE